jgi:hypothetical protein
LEDYKKCETCEAGKGLNSEGNCVACKSKSCGVCNDDYKKCDAKICKCPDAPVKKAATASKSGKYAPDGGFNYCESKPGFTGSGYSSTFTAAVVDGTCIDCNGEHFRPYSEGKTSFCVFNAIGRSVAAMAFKAKSGCSYPKSVKLTLTRTCLNQAKTYPYTMNLVYSAEYCGEKKIVIAAGGGSYNNKGKAVPNALDKWEYIVKP